MISLQDNIWNNIKLDSIEGDYIEFGIFKGKSLFHSFSTAKKNKIIHNRIFWGLDSFEGFPTENHSFYTSKNFDVSYEKVIKQFSKYENIKIKKGYFSQSLNNKNISEINKIAFAFVDCDIYESSLDVFDFLKKRMTNGGFIMIDDYTSIDNNGNTISKSFLSNFEINKNVYVGEADVLGQRVKKGEGRIGLKKDWDKFMWFEINPDYNMFLEELEHFLIRTFASILKNDVDIEPIINSKIKLVNRQLRKKKI